MAEKFDDEWRNAVQYHIGAPRGTNVSRLAILRAAALPAFQIHGRARPHNVENRRHSRRNRRNGFDPSRTQLLTWIPISRPLITCTRRPGARYIMPAVIMLPTLGPVNRVCLQRAR